MEKSGKRLVLRSVFSIVLFILFLALIIAPSFYFVLNSDPSSDAFFFNGTEIANGTGLRLSAAVLSMDFNGKEETPYTSSYSCNVSTGCTGTYIKDGSVYNNYGTIDGILNASAWHNEGSKVNNSLQFDGVNDYISINNNTLGNFNKTDPFTVSAWYKSNAFATYGTIMAKSDASFTNGWKLFWVSTSGGQMRFSTANWNSEYAYYAQTNDDTWHHVVAVWNTTTMILYKDGVVSANTYATASNLTSSGTNISIGTTTSGFGLFKGSIDEPMLFNRVLTSAEITALYNNQSAGLRASGLETDPNLVSYWYLDELSGTKAVDAIGGINNGTLTNYPTSFTTPTYNATGGISGSGAYQFDGVDDYVNVTASSIVGGAQDHTISFWVNAKTLAASFTRNGILTRTGNYLIFLNSGNVQVVYSKSGGGSYSYAATKSWDLNKWYYITITKNINVTPSIYIDGVLQTISCITGGCDNTSTSASSNLDLGKEVIGYTSLYFNGSIDNVQIFNRALSASEVLAMYNGTLANKSNKYSATQGDFKSLVFYNSTSTYWNINLSTADTQSRGSNIVNIDNSINLSNPNLVSYWALDGNYLDATGRNNGTCTSCPNNASGLSGGAMRFDGVGNYINISNKSSLNPTANLTIAGWFYFYNVTNTAVAVSRYDYGSNNRSYSLQVLGPTQKLVGYISKDGTYTAGTTGFEVTYAVTTNNWYHAAFVADAGNNTLKLYINGVLVNTTTDADFTSIYTTGTNTIIGNYFNNGAVVAGRYLNATTSDILIYNTSLTASQIAQLYKSGLSRKATTNITIQTRTANTYNITDPSLVALWGLNNAADESATLFKDELGINNGTCTGTACPTLNQSGIVGNSYTFDGANDVINITTTVLDSPRNWSISFWANTAKVGSYPAIILLNMTGGALDPSGVVINNARFQLLYNDSNKIQGSLIIPNKWYHIVVTSLNNTVWTMYENGVAGNATGVGSAWNVAGNTIGKGYAAESYNGTIDDIRIYNRTLTANEVQNLYELGSYHISDWTAWTNETIAPDDSAGINTQAGGKFMQFKTNLYTNTTDQSPYLLSYNVTYAPEIYAPNITSITPANNSNINTNLTGEINFTANITEDLAGIKNATLNIYNSTSLVNQTTLNVSSTTGLLSASIGIVVSLVEGFHQWFFEVFDWNNNLYTSSNQTLIVDNISPNVTLNIPENNYVLNQSNQDVNIQAYSPTSFSNNNLDSVFINASEISNGTGVRLSAAVLSMDFNSPQETPYTSSYSCNDSTGCTGTYIKDGSVYNNFGTIDGILNASAWHNEGSKVNNSLQFDGVNDYVNATISVGQVSNISGTILLWFNRRGSGDLTEEFMFASPAGTGIRYYLELTAGQIKCRLGNDAALSTNVNYLNNTWYHVALSWNSSGSFCYVNGSLKVEGNNTLTSNLTLFNLGQLALQNNNHFNGSIDEVMIFNRTLSTTEITNLYENQSLGSQSYLANDGDLVSYLKLDELSGTNAVNSKTGINNGTLIGYPTATSPVYNATGGISGSGAYQFDGVNDLITIPNSVSLNPQKITLSAWIKTNSSSTEQFFFNKQDNSFYVRVNAGKVEFYLLTVCASWLQTPATYNDNNWHFFTGTYDGKNKLIYMDGNLVAANYTCPGGDIPSSGTSNVAIGRRLGVVSTFFNGSIDNPQIFPTALSPTDILAMYNGSVANMSNKYSTTQGDFKSGVFYNSTQTYWNISLSTADTTSRSGIVNADNSINLSNPNLVSYWALDGNYNDAKSITNLSCGSACPNNATGLSSGAMRFNSNASSFLINNQTSDITNLKNIQKGAVSLWFNAFSTPPTSSMYLFSASNSSFTGGSCGGAGVYIGYNSANQISYLMCNSAGSIIVNSYTVGQALTTKTWHHLLQMTNESGTFIYVDTVLYPLITGNTSTAYFVNVSNMNNVRIGNSEGVRYFNGTIDEVLIYNTSLTSSQVSQLYKSGLSQKANTNVTIQTRTANTYNITDPSLIGFWSFNENNNITAIDELGRNNGTYLNGALSNITSGVVASGGYFDGVNDYVNLSNLGDLGYTSFSYGLWVYPFSSVGGYDMPFSKGGGTATEIGFDMELGSGAWEAYLSNGATNTPQITFSTSPLNNRWSHLFVVANKESGRLTGYLNGNLVSNVSLNAGNFNSSKVLVLGRFYNLSYPASYGFNGFIDEVRIYNRSLSASEVQDLYNLGTTHISDWTAWTSEALTSDGAGVNTNVSSKFVQYMAGLYSNTTDQSPYIVSSNVSGVVINRALSSINLTANLSDNLAGIINATLYVVNAINTSQQVTTSTLTLNNPLSVAIGIVVSFVDGFYQWFYRIFDAAANSMLSTNYTLIVDNILPNVVLNTPASEIYTNSLNINFTANVTDNVFVKNASVYIYNSTNLVINQTRNSINSTSASIGINLSLADGNYTWFYDVFDYGNYRNISATNNTIIIDTTLPIPYFISPTPNNNSGSNQQITLMINVTELYPKNATLDWGNETSRTLYYFNLANFTQIDANTYQFNTTNKSALLAGQFYYYNITVCDQANNCNVTQTRLVKGNTAPTITVNSDTTQSGNYSTNQIIANISFIDGETNMNASYIYLYYRNNWQNSTIILLNETFDNSSTTFINIYLNYSNLSQGIYYLNATASDFVGEISNSSTRVIVLDTTSPNGTLLYSNNTYFNYTSVNLTTNLSDNLGIANASLFVYNYSNSSQLINQTILYFAQGTVSTTVGIIVNLVDGWYSWFYQLFDWASNSFTTENNTLITDTINPSIASIVLSPYDNDSFDPNTRITFNVSLIDDTAGINSSYLEIFNSTDWTNYSMNLVNGTIYDGVWNTSFTTLPEEKIYQYRIWANDKSNNINETLNQSIYAYYDCTWNVSTGNINNAYAFESVGGFYQDKLIGNISIRNTGDSQYSNNNCSITFARDTLSNAFYSGSSYYSGNGRELNFSLQYYLNGGSGLIYKLNGNTITSLQVNASQNKSIELYGNFPVLTSVNQLVEYPYFTIASSINDTETRINNVTITARMVITPGAYLDTAFEPSSQTVYLTAGNFTLPSYIRNLVDASDNPQNNTAYNINQTLTLDSTLESLLSSGDLNLSLDILNTTAKTYNNLTFTLTTSNIVSMPLSTYYAYSNLIGYENSSGNLSLINYGNNQTYTNATGAITFACYSTKDSVCVSACINLTAGLVYDSDCSIPSTTTTVSGGTGGGGGGGGGGVAITSNKIEKSEATYELLRGASQTFQLEIKNKYPQVIENLIIDVSGLNSEYIALSEKSISSLAPGESKNITVTISAPAYFTGKKYELVFDISGLLITESGGVKSGIGVTDKRAVTLYILEVSRQEADNLSDASLILVNEMNLSSMNTKEALSLLEQQKKAYDNLDFLQVKNIGEKINLIYSNAFESKKTLEELTLAIKEAERNGITTYETQKMVYLAQVAYERGDYTAALERLKQAKLVYAVETKGEFNLLITIKNNPLESMGIILAVAIAGTVLTFAVRLRLYKRKLKSLTEEEVLLLELMKMVQRQCFEQARLSMEEYDQAMLQYESKLSETIEEKIRTETKIANLIKIGGKKKALDEEKKRIIQLIRAVQDDYLNKGKIETRIYENMLKSYSTRLTEVDEQLAYAEAQEALKKQSRLNREFKV